MALLTNPAFDRPLRVARITKSLRMGQRVASGTTGQVIQDSGQVGNDFAEGALHDRQILLGNRLEKQSFVLPGVLDDRENSRLAIGGQRDSASFINGEQTKLNHRFENMATRIEFEKKFRQHGLQGALRACMHRLEQTGLHEGESEPDGLSPLLQPCRDRAVSTNHQQRQHLFIQTERHLCVGRRGEHPRVRMVRGNCISTFCKQP